MNHANLPSDPTIAGKLVDAEASTNKVKLDRGWIGAALGSRDHVPNNIAGIVVAVTLAAIIYLVTCEGEFATKRDAIAVLTPILTLFGGYLFGRVSKD